MEPSEIIIDLDRSRHRFFDQALAVFVGIYSLGSAFRLRQQGQSAYVPRDNFLHIAGSAVTDQEILFLPDAVFDEVLSNRWPDHIQIASRKRTGILPEDPFGLGPDSGIPRVVAAVVMSHFVLYYETVVGQVRAKHGSDCRGWPPVWNFARVVRNAFAHGGVIAFENPSAAPVSWRSLMYGPRDNGKQVLFADLSPVEILYLWLDLDAAI